LIVIGMTSHRSVKLASIRRKSGAKLGLDRSQCAAKKRRLALQRNKAMVFVKTP
jgi:hypothetical protein